MCNRFPVLVLLTLAALSAAAGCDEQTAQPVRQAETPGGGTSPTAAGLGTSSLARRYRLGATAPEAQRPRTGAPRSNPEPLPVLGTWVPSGWMGDAENP